MPQPSTPSPTRLNLPGAEILLHPTFLSPAEADELFAHLLTEIPWQQREVFVWGRWRRQPRLVSWHGDPGTAYSYSGITLEPAPWTPTLQGLRERVEGATGTPFNSVLLNLYRDHNDGMGWHSDDEPELGRSPTIASVSLGEERDFLLQPRRDAGLRRQQVRLAHGSLLIMAGETQHNWRHAIAKQRRPLGQRINLTFRRVLHSAPRADVIPSR